MAVKRCKHCGRSFDTRLVDIRRHEQNCREHVRAVVRRNIARINQGKPTTRTGW